LEDPSEQQCQYRLCWHPCQMPQYCQKQCACKGKAEEPLTKFLRD
jgi:hypothetical protein